MQSKPIITDLEGKVTQIKNNSRSTIRLTLESNDDKKTRTEITIPYTAETEFDLIPLNLALLNRTVQYHNESSYLITGMDSGPVNNYKLRIIEGPLEGQVFSALYC